MVTERPIPTNTIEQWEFTQPPLRAFQVYQRPIVNTFARINGLLHDYRRQVDYLEHGVFSGEVDRKAMIRQRAEVALVDLTQLVADSEPLEPSMAEQIDNLLLYFKQQAQPTKE